ncbi:glycosyltransferase family 4 protein [Sulfuricystis multivorans]|uniref:glycosyltransferase family 4 protein n=1 Tax=Sulfuricystis multivorans TaxID=2211108 RepID=UPI000F834AD6|nr:glycosyltransferase family 4 protein [Sulfuricystis multivorans]
MSVSLHSSFPKILMASHHASRRGSAISLVELGRRLPEFGYEPFFVFSKDGPLLDDLRSQDMPSEVVKRRGWLRWPLIRDTIALIRRNRIDLAHVNSAVPFAKYVALAAKWCGIPVVWHIREPIEDKRMKRQRPWILRLADKIVVLTREQADYFACPDKIVRIFNGVELANFRRQMPIEDAKRALGLAPDNFLFVQIGSIETNKGQARTIKAFAALLAQAAHARLLIVGAPVESDALDELQLLIAADSALRSTVRLHGATEDVASVLWAADCLVLPSLRESFPRTVMEAMASGVPVIATRVGALADMIDDGSTGWLVPPDDHAALVRAMDKAMRLDASERIEYARRCVAVAEERFSMAAHVTAVTKLYGRLLGQGGMTPNEQRNRL